MARIVCKSDAARLLGGVSTKTVDRLRAAGELDALAVRGRVMIGVDSIEAYIERQLRAGRCPRVPPSSRRDAGSLADDPFPIPALRERRGG